MKPLKNLPIAFKPKPASAHAYPVESNAVFLQLDEPIAAGLQRRGWYFYRFVEPDIYRLMCSWAVTDALVEEFVWDVKKLRRSG